MINIILIILIIALDIYLFTSPKTRDSLTKEIIELWLIDDNGKKTKIDEWESKGE